MRPSHARRFGYAAAAVGALLTAALLLADTNIPADRLVQPADLAAQLSQGGHKPAVVQVGFNVLYRSKHIPGAAYAGPASKPEGVAELKRYVSPLPRNAEIVLYCGCCPWDKCPNMRPAFAVLHEMGFQNVKALYIPDNFAQDWVNKGYPTESGR